MLNSKQRAYLRSLSNGIETVVIVGKGGVNENVITGAQNALTARELIKCRALESCELSPRETAESIASAIEADVVQVIGTRFVLYKENKKIDRDKRIQLPSL